MQLSYSLHHFPGIFFLSFRGTFALHMKVVWGCIGVFIAQEADCIDLLGHGHTVDWYNGDKCFDVIHVLILASLLFGVCFSPSSLFLIFPPFSFVPFSSMIPGHGVRDTMLAFAIFLHHRHHVCSPSH